MNRWLANFGEYLLLRVLMNCQSIGTRVDCPSGFGCCDTGYCAPSDGVCCSSGRSCEAGEGCCGSNNCYPLGSDCCSDGTYCEAPSFCVISPRTGSVVCDLPPGVNGFGVSEDIEEEEVEDVVEEVEDVVDEAEDAVEPLTTEPPPPPPPAENDEETVVVALSTYYYTVTWYEECSLNRFLIKNSLMNLYRFYFSYYYRYIGLKGSSEVTSTEMTERTTFTISASNEAIAQRAFTESTKTLELPTPAEATTALASAVDERPSLTTAANEFTLDSASTPLLPDDDDDDDDDEDDEDDTTDLSTSASNSLVVNIAFVLFLCGPGIALILS